MSKDKQPQDADLEDDVAAKAKSAEDRKAAQALASLDAAGGDDGNKHVDHEAVSKAMKNLAIAGGSGAAGASDKGKAAPAKAAPAKKIKIDAADVALLVDELELSKVKATDLLKQHEGDAVQALRAYIAVN